MEYPYLNGERIYLRLVEERDVAQLTKINNTAITRIMGDDDVPYPFSLETMSQFTKSNETMKNFAICRIKDDELIGSLAVYGINYQNSNCEIGLIVAEDAKRQGYGDEAMKIIIEFVFNYLPMNKIKLQVFSFNTAAINLYQQLGFTHEGTLKEEIFRFGTYQDLENYALLRSEWMNHH
ncbi:MULTISPECIES: GNAT family N-acetyltransferase [Enterococcus]|uniref:N-acetyltransferase domain-containing protein n=1 Tax=Enterococcus sulfureus ATCC 49903 TaxID=1140003 RepID=S0KZN4_9ENTE|nr:GNAT family protein [Enterococcus sulfureus]EOT46515.1 hypothetical protein OMY_01664 [Enterococcus sulfureus ATCC 49903]EOT86172.1 hypothetical protein I573_00925 [Enterococcus sulfureus ATCC 49903]